MIVDCETHIFPRIADFQGCHVGDLLRDMDQCGVDRTFLTFYSDSTFISPCGEVNPGEQRFGDTDEEVWEYFKASWLEHKDRFFFFSVPDPRDPDCIKKLEAQRALGLQGIGETQPASQNILPNGPEFMRVYRFAADNGLPVVLTMERWEHCLTFQGTAFADFFDMFEKVIREFKDVRFMIGHAGDCGSVRAPAATWEAYAANNLHVYKMAAELDNVWICSCMPWWFTDDVISPRLEQQVKFLKEHVGFSKVTWGSDWPYSGGGTDFCFRSDYATVAGFYRNLSFCSEEELELLLGRSACEFVAGP